ncbi:hypothetical protein XENORESO_017801 [Xenotaenia resolanae]|uniref:Uncharacterized protein n=1 Tax=Xenotaenia resolanae TaxID=208358 RepID=A0ABV0W422_9TELE
MYDLVLANVFTSHPSSFSSVRSSFLFPIIFLLHPASDGMLLSCGLKFSITQQTCFVSVLVPFFYPFYPSFSTCTTTITSMHPLHLSTLSLLVLGHSKQAAQVRHSLPIHPLSIFFTVLSSLCFNVCMLLLLMP